MDSFTRGRAKERSAFCFSATLSPSSCPQSLLIFLIRNPFSVTALVFFSSGDMYFHHFPLLVCVL